MHGYSNLSDSLKRKSRNVQAEFILLARIHLLVYTNDYGIENIYRKNILLCLKYVEKNDFYVKIMKECYCLGIIIFAKYFTNDYFNLKSLECIITLKNTFPRVRWPWVGWIPPVLILSRLLFLSSRHVSALYLWPHWKYVSTWSWANGHRAISTLGTFDFCA